MKTLRLLLATLLLTGPLAAQADLVQFDMTVNGNTASWQLDMSPTPDAVFSNSFAIFDVLVTTDFDSFLVDLFFYDAFAGGGFDITDSETALFIYGPELFSGPLAGPQFLIGDFVFDNVTVCTINGCDPLGMLLYLSITIVSVPEPGTLALFGLGLAGLVAARRRKLA